jgi:hypothetical protein
MRELLDAKAHALEREFPVAVREWGGPRVLRDRVAVEKIFRDLGGVPDSPKEEETRVEPVPLPESFGIAEADRDRRRELTDRLRMVGQRHDELARTPEPRAFPLWAAFLLSLPFAGPAAGGAFEFVRTFFAPHSQYAQVGGREGGGFPRPESWVDFRNSPISEEQYVRLERLVRAFAGLAAGLAGLAVMGTITWLLSSRRSCRIHLVLGVLLCLPPAVGLGAGAAFTLHSFFSPYKVSSRSIENQNYSDTHYDFRGQQLSPTQYALLSRQTFASFNLVGVVVGACLVVGANWFYQRRLRRQRSEGLAGLDAALRALAEAFPRTVRHWGDLDFLRQPAAARRALLLVESN